MCRIFGVSYGDQREELDTAEIAAILYPALVHQGPHAWGWMSHKAGADSIEWEKTPGRCDTPAAYAQQIETIDPDAKWFVGHLRYATHGSPQDNRNNHPIIHRGILGIHNGVLRNHDDILKITGRQDPKTLVDSEAIFAAVRKWGPVNGLKRIEGDMVTVYARTEKPHVLHIGRTHGRQCTVGWTERGNIIFASEEQALRKLEPEIKFTHFSTISENRLLILRDGKIIGRHRFAPVRPKTYRAPAPTVIGRAKPSTSATQDTYLDRLLMEERAKRRGDLFFAKKEREKIVSSGKGKKGKKGKGRGRGERSSPKAITGQIDDIIDGNGIVPDPAEGQERKLWYYDGILMTYDEYAQYVEANQ